MRNNKILFFITSLAGGGAERVLVTLANSFANNGKEVYIATSQINASAYPLKETIRRIGINTGFYEDYGGTKLSSLKYYLVRFRRIRQIVKDISPDVVISFITQTNNEVIFSMLGLRIPLVVCEYTNVLRSYDKKTTFFRKFLYPFATAITVLTRHDYKLWKGKYRQVVYMPNPVVIYKNVELTPMKARKKVVLAVGTVKSWKIKGFDNLIRSWGLR